MLDTYIKRFVSRAIVVGGMAFIAAFEGADDPLTTAALKGALSAAVYAVVGLLTPIEGKVGLFKS